MRPLGPSSARAAIEATALAAGTLIARESGALTGGRPGDPASGELTLAASEGVFGVLQGFLEEWGAWRD